MERVDPGPVGEQLRAWREQEHKAAAASKVTEAERAAAFAAQADAVARAKLEAAKAGG